MAKGLKMFFEIEPKYNMIMKFRFRFLLILLFICFLKGSNSFSFSLYLVSRKNRFSITSNQKRKFKAGKNHQSNIVFTYFSLLSFFTLTISIVIGMIFVIILSGDVHPNPGPTEYEESPDTSSTYSNDIYNFLNLPNHLSVVHYNVQSIRHKIDLLFAEFSQFDIISFTETWLEETFPSSELLFKSFYPPERKDRISNPYGGVLVYVKDSLSYVRRNDLEMKEVECIWIQIKLCNNKNILHGTFYRPPNSNLHYTSLLEDSISLAIDSNITDVVITGDFNLNYLNAASYRKINVLCNQYNMSQLIEEPTHLTECSHSLIDLMFVTNKESIITSGVGIPVLENSIRYHCPIFSVLNFLKPKHNSYRRIIWKYDLGDYNALRNYFNNINWDELKSNDIDIYAQNITDVIKRGRGNTIPHKTVNVKAHEPPWITSLIKRKIRQRKRLYKKARKSNNPSKWLKFKKV